jgi:predicted nucleic acid-binding protein
VPLEVLETGPRLQARALRLGCDLDHPVHDCLYLALALDRGTALATADRRFLRILRRAAVLPPERLLIPPEAAT